jgi:hypothetical protein
MYPFVKPFSRFLKLSSFWHTTHTPHFATTMSRSSFVKLDDELAFLEASGHDDRGRDETDKMLLQHQLITSPLLNFSAVRHHAEAFPSRGLLGTTDGERLYMNTNTPSSGVICGVQVSLVWLGGPMSLTKDWNRAQARATPYLAFWRPPSSWTQGSGNCLNHSQHSCTLFLSR